MLNEHIPFPDYDIRYQPFIDSFLESAEKGNHADASALIDLVRRQIEQGAFLSPRLCAFFVGVLRDPAKYLEIMTWEPKKSRGGQSIDVRPRKIVGFSRIRGFGSKPTEINALAIHYLHSQGHTLNVAGNAEKEAATVIISRLAGRSPRSLETDYQRHKQTILEMDSEQLMVLIMYAWDQLEKLAEYRRKADKQSLSQ